MYTSFNETSSGNGTANEAGTTVYLTETEIESIQDLFLSHTPTHTEREEDNLTQHRRPCTLRAPHMQRVGPPLAVGSHQRHALGQEQQSLLNLRGLG